MQLLHTQGLGGVAGMSVVDVATSGLISRTLGGAAGVPVVGVAKSGLVCRALNMLLEKWSLVTSAFSCSVSTSSQPCSPC